MGVCCAKEHQRVKITPGKRPAHSDVGQHSKLQSNSYLDISQYYQFIRVCGFGQFGTVREAKRIKNQYKENQLNRQKSMYNANKSYAVKSILKQRVTQHLKMLKNEIEVIKTADHPNIVRLYEVYEDDKYLHLVMDLLTGNDLLEVLLASGPMTEIQAANLMRKIFHAVAHLHTFNIAHRDIKPDNIMFANNSEDAEPKLVDFGMSIMNEKSDLTSKVGTPYYIAPEVINGIYSKECDIWSLGVTLYFMLSLTYPFNGQSMSQLLSAIQKGQYDFKSKPNQMTNWQQISREAKDLISKMLITKPQKRISLEKALKHSWFTKSSRNNPPLIGSQLISTMAAPKIHGKMQKEVMKVLVRNLQEADIACMNDLFMFMDKGQTGVIKIEDLQSALQTSGLQIASKEMKKIMKNFRYYTETSIKYTEFLAMVMDTKCLIEEENLWAAFKYFDSDNDNLISLSDLKGALQRAGCNIEEEDMQQILQEFQLNTEESMSFEQFKGVMMCKFYAGFSEQNSPEESMEAPIERSGIRTFSRRRVTVLNTQAPNYRRQSLRGSLLPTNRRQSFDQSALRNSLARGSGRFSQIMTRNAEQVNEMRLLINKYQQDQNAIPEIEEIDSPLLEKDYEYQVSGTEPVLVSHFSKISTD